MVTDIFMKLTISNCTVKCLIKAHVNKVLFCYTTFDTFMLIAVK